jgi:hypothetical protein
MNYRLCWLLLVIAVSTFSCTSNPFGGNEVSAKKRTIKGKIILTDNNDSLQDVYVWLEGFDIATRTNASGEFQLTLPPPSAQGSGSGADGVYKLYYYIANYELEFSELGVRNGEFLFGVGEVNSAGELSSPKSLTKVLDIQSEVTPPIVSQNRIDPIEARVTLKSLVDSVSVGFPNSIGGFLGGVFLRNTATGRVHVVKGPPNTEIDTRVISREPSSRAMLFSLLQNPLPVGNYEVIPYLLVQHEVIPAELLVKLGPNIAGLNETYLNLPFKRDSAILTVAN